MASNPRAILASILLALGLALLCVASIALINTMTGNAGDNTFVIPDSHNEVRGVRAQLLINEDIGQSQTNDVDVSQYSQLLIELLKHARNETMKSPSTVYQLCNVEIEMINGRKIKIIIVSVGKSSFMFLTDEGKLYIRDDGYYPIRHPDIYIDESLAFCSLVRAVAEQRKKDADDAEKMLRLSAGL